MTPLKRILLVEDSARDAELILDALGGHQLANEVVHVRDGADALDYLYRRGQFADRSDGQPALMLLDLKLPKVDGLEVLRQIKGDAGAQDDSRRDDDVLARRAGSAAQLPARRQCLCGQADEVSGFRRGGEAGGRVLGGDQRSAAGERARSVSAGS